jgi:uncharacterized short protein YbdD (DUF466 family)
MRTEGGKAGGRAGGQLLGAWRSFITLLRQVAGMPDYNAYLEHIRLHHPGMAAVSEREFFDRYVRARSGGVSRCC